MAFIIMGTCIGVKNSSCADVCPAECISFVMVPEEAKEGAKQGGNKGEMMLVDNEECIECGRCVEACPVDAVIEVDEDDSGLGKEERKWLTINLNISSYNPVEFDRKSFREGNEIEE